MLTMGSSNHLPVMQLWRLLIDRKDQAKGPLHMDQNEPEPGYLQSMFHALNHLFEAYNRRLDVNFLIQLHDQAVSGIFTSARGTDGGQPVEILTSFTLGLRDNAYVSFGLVTDDDPNVSKAGLRELLEQLGQGDDYFCIEKNSSETIASCDTVKIPIDDAQLETMWELLKQTPCRIYIKPMSQNQLIARLEKIIAIYHQNIVNAKDVSEKLRVILTCIHQLELTHPFYDGNCRTMAILLLNQLLLQNHLPLTILSRRDRIDAFSIEELCQEVVAGQETLKHLKAEDNQASLLYLSNNHFFARLLVVEVIQNSRICIGVDEGVLKKAKEAISRQLANTISNRALSQEDILQIKVLIEKDLTERLQNQSWLFSRRKPIDYRLVDTDQNQSLPNESQCKIGK